MPTSCAASRSPPSKPLPLSATTISMKWKPFSTKPPGIPEGLPDMAAAPKHPLIVNLHGGPHGQNGPAFAFKNQDLRLRTAGRCCR